MTAQVLIDAFQIPEDARVDQRIPKKLLTEQGAPTAADKRAIQDGIEDVYWRAALKPTNVGIPDFRDETREYLEIAVLVATLRDNAKVARLTELFHRAIPYPLVLIIEHERNMSMSLAHKRWSQGEAGKTVVESVLAAPAIRADSPTAVDRQFLETLPLARQPSTSLLAVYQGWINQVEAFAAAQITGRFVPLTDVDAIGRRRTALGERQRLEREAALLRSQAARESQLNRRVELNNQIQRLEQQLREGAENL